MTRLTNEQLFQALWNRREKLADLRGDLVRLYGWPVTDIRLTALTKIENVVGSTALGLESLTEFLCQPRQCLDGKLYPPISKDVEFEFNNYLRLSFVQFIFTAVESSMRLILRAINPEACGKGTSSFKSIYECLIRAELNLDESQDWINLLDLFRIIRNSLHNNGVYFHATANNVNVLYRGRVYEFSHGKCLDFVYWDLKLSLLDDVLSLIETILQHPKIQNLSYIKDPFAF